MASVALLGLGACQSEDFSMGSGEETTMNFTVALADGASSRVGVEDTGDGTKADRAVLEVYEQKTDGSTTKYELYGTQKVAEVTGKKATFNNVRVVSGRTYKFVFWADKKGASLNEGKYYTTTSLTNIKMKDGDYVVNNDERDAFFAAEELTVNKSETRTIELKRPFAQINLLTTDLADVPEKDRPAKVKVTYTSGSVSDSFNALTGFIGVDKQFTSTVVPAMDAASGYELMDYLFVFGEQETLIDFKTEFYREDGSLITTNEQTTNIPLRRNYRTTISGNLLTNGLNYNVVIAPEFAGTIDREYVDDAALAAGGDWYVGKATNKIDLSNVNPEKDLQLNLFAAVGELVIGSKAATANHITVNVSAGVAYPKITVADNTHIDNFTLKGDPNSSTALETGLEISNKVVEMNNVTIDGIHVSKLPLNIRAKKVTGMTVKNVKADNMNEDTRFIDFQSVEMSGTILFENNDITLTNTDKVSGGNWSGFRFAYTNGGDIIVRGNTVRGGQSGYDMMPGDGKTPNSQLVENNKFIGNYDCAIVIQWPDNSIIVRNNILDATENHISDGKTTNSGALTFMQFRKANTPDILVEGNTISQYKGAERVVYAVTPAGYNSQWGGNDEGCSAKIVYRNNVKAGNQSKTWVGWFYKITPEVTNNMTLLDGSDVSNPYKN